MYPKPLNFIWFWFMLLFYKKMKIMKKVKQSAILLIMVIFISCGEKKPSTPQILAIENKIKTNEYFSFNKLVKDVSSVELETGPGKYISGVSKVFVTKGSSILLLNGATEIFEYNKNGNFIRKIGKTGRGPGEYTEAKDFCISKDELLISILTRLSIHIYNANEWLLLLSHIL